MESDRELLEMAAKAAGRVGFWDEDDEYFGLHEDGFLGQIEWNPTADLCDCADMEERLKINIQWRRNYVEAEIRRHGKDTHVAAEVYADHNNDRQRARMMASTRAAAAIGRSMP